MGTTKIKITRTAKKKSGSSQGTVKISNKMTVSPDKVTKSKTRTVAKKGPSVNYVKSS